MPECPPPRGPWATPAGCDRGHGIAVLDYGIGNLGSAHKALVHLGADARLVVDADEAAGASGVVLPGVGAFGPCARALRSTGLDRAVDDALERKVPFLGICVGFQLLYEGSEESPTVPGPGAIRSRAAHEATDRCHHSASASSSQGPRINVATSIAPSSAHRMLDTCPPS